MKLTSATLLLLLAISMSPVLGFLEGNYTSMKCNCMQNTRNFIPLHLIQRFQIYPAGSGCPNVEILVQMKNKNIVCVSPHATWFIKFLKIIQKKNGSSFPLPGIKRSTK